MMLGLHNGFDFFLKVQSRHDKLYRIVLYHIVSYRIILYHIGSYPIYCVALQRIVSYRKAIKNKNPPAEIMSPHYHGLAGSHEEVTIASSFFEFEPFSVCLHES